MNKGRVISSPTFLVAARHMPAREATSQCPFRAARKEPVASIRKVDSVYAFEKKKLTGLNIRNMTAGASDAGVFIVDPDKRVQEETRRDEAGV
jgi:hypothetical protein